MNRRFLLFSVCIFLFWVAPLFPQQNDILPVDYRNHKNIKPFDPQVMPLFSISTSTGVWTELNPRIPRTDYLSICFANKDTGWSVGANGAIIKTTDAGISWITKQSNVTVVLKTAATYNGKIVIAAGDYGTILRSTDAGETWTQITCGASAHFWNGKFVNDSIVWLVGEAGNCYKSVNSGITWNLITTPLQSSPHWDVSFVNENFGYICSDGGKVIKTTDGGVNWQLLQAGSAYPLYTIVALDTSYVTAAGGNYMRFVFSSNGGTTWSQSLLSMESPVNKIAFVNDTLGFAVNKEGYSYKTTNKGNDWTVVPLIGEWGLCFINGSIGYSSGEDMKLKKSTNMGSTWSPMIMNGNFEGISTVSNEKLWIFDSLLYKSIDGGLNWESINPATMMSSIYFLDSLTGFVGTLSNRIYKTSDGGNTWIRKHISGLADSLYDIRSFYFINNNIGWSGSRYKGIFKTTDRGETWFTQTNSVSGEAIQFFDSLKGYTVSGYFNKTFDGGTNWQIIPLPGFGVHDLFFLDSLNGWVITDKLYKTTSAGTNWTAVPELTGIGGGHFGRISNSHFFIIGSQSTQCYETTDSGSTWQNIPSLSNQGLNLFHSSSLTTGYAVGKMGLILKYTDTSVVPVELNSFSYEIRNNKILLNWSTATELNNYGFEVQRKHFDTDFVTLTFIPGKGSTTVGQNYSYEDYLTYSGEPYFYRLKQRDYNGSNTYSRILEINYSNQINNFYLEQNFPNPFNPTTQIRFTTNQNGYGTLKLYNILGEEIRQLYAGELKAGNQYNVQLTSSDLQTGVYFYTLKMVNKSVTRKLMIIK